VDLRGVPLEPLRSGRLAWVGLAVALAFIAAQTAAHLVDFWAFGLRNAALDADAEGTAFAWFAISALGLGAVAAGTAAVQSVGDRSRLGLLTVLLVLIVGAEASDARERIPHGTAVLAVLFVLALTLLWTVPSRTVRTGVALVVASLAIHVLGPPLASALGYGPDDALYQVKVALKEGTERGGFVAIALGLCAVALGRPRPR
jgi:hypothetical protein